MKRPIKTLFKYTKRYGMTVFFVVLGYVSLMALLGLPVFQKIELEYQKSTSQFLYAPAPELSSVANVYLDSQKNFVGEGVSDLIRLLSYLKKKSPEKIFIVLNPKDLKKCEGLTDDFRNTTLIFTNTNVSADCFKNFREKNISFLGTHEFGVDLGKGEIIYVQNAKDHFYKNHKLAHNQDQIANLALSISRIPQIDAQELLNSTGAKKAKVTDLKSKTIFIGYKMQNSNAQASVLSMAGQSEEHGTRPFTFSSSKLSEDYALSALYFQLQEDAFLQAASPRTQYFLWAALFLQVFFSLVYFNQWTSFFMISAVTLEVLVLTALAPVVLGLSLPMSHGLVTMVFAMIYAQAFKRCELERVVRRTQKLLSARSLFNNQLLNSKKSLKVTPASLDLKDTETSDFNKYFTKLDVVDSIHGVVIPDINSQDENSSSGNNNITASNANNNRNHNHSNNDSSSTPSKPEASVKNTAKPMTSITAASTVAKKSATVEKSETQKSSMNKPKPLFAEQKPQRAPRFTHNFKKTEKTDTKTQPQIFFKPTLKKEDSHRPAKKMFVNIDVKPQDKVIPKTEAPKFKILKPSTEVEAVVQKPSAEDVVLTVPQASIIAQNFQTLFANNLKRKELSFKLIGEKKAAKGEAQICETKKRQLFFEALCIQIINDAVPGTEIEFSTHEKDGYVIYFISHQSLKQFNYKEWLKNAAFFQGLAGELREQGVVIYQNRSEGENTQDLAVGFKTLKGQVFKVA